MKKIRMKTRDVAFTYRMGAGFPGDVNRTHPVSIEPDLIDTTYPPTLYGQAVLVDATSHGVRHLIAADASDTAAPMYGVTVRPYPAQQAASASDFGAAAIGSVAPPTSGVIDTCRSGYIMANVPSGQTPVKDGLVYVWCAASTGVHVQGGFESVISSGNTALVSNARFNGSPDANGNVEIAFNI